MSDGLTTYTYDRANRLSTAVEGGVTYAFTYSGLGDRLRQTVSGTPTTYTLDLHAGLTEVLSDGANAYLYGNGGIGEEQAAGWVYHLGDALGSVRQLGDPSADVALAQSYEPFGETLTSTGTRTPNFQLGVRSPEHVLWPIQEARLSGQSKPPGYVLECRHSACPFGGRLRDRTRKSTVSASRGIDAAKSNGRC